MGIQLFALIISCISAVAIDVDVELCVKNAKNMIARENCLPGSPSTEWDVNGAGDPTIQGFATQISVNRGEQIEFKILTPSSSYRLDIWRLGYYHGNGARLVSKNIRPQIDLPQEQPACIRDNSTWLVDCGNWNVSASWHVPSDAVSGLYFARAVREDPLQISNWRADNSPLTGDIHHARPNTDPLIPPKRLIHSYGACGHGKQRNAMKEPRASHIWFVVRDDEGKSEILFQTSDQTWQAYNGYGGLTTYGSFAYPWTHGPSPWILPLNGPSPRAFKASYNRPLITRGYRAVNMPLNAEYPAIRFLEASGYDVSYTSGVDGATNGMRILTHRTFLSIGHDEYWSGEQREAVTIARDMGVNLAFLSGNEMYWKVRWENSIVDNTPYRTMVIYKESQANKKIDPTNIWTGTFRDARDINPEGAAPENAVTGTIWTVNAQRVDSLQIPASFSKLRFWRHTQVALLSDGEKYTSLKGILGHEWDEDIDNGFRPDGLVRLSETLVDNVQYIQDHGSVFDTASATHHLTMYRAESGALVFGAGTVQWVWGLDSHHDVNDPPRGNMYSIRVEVDVHGPDVTIQQATVNFLADFGSQPTTLPDHLVMTKASVDTTPPTSTIVHVNDTRNTNGMIVVDVEAKDDDGCVAAVEVSLNGGIRFHPAQPVFSRLSFTYSSTVQVWRYVWGVNEFDALYDDAMLYDINPRSRAVDDSYNMEQLNSVHNEL